MFVHIHSLQGLNTFEYMYTAGGTNKMENWCTTNKKKSFSSHRELPSHSIKAHMDGVLET